MALPRRNTSPSMRRTLDIVADNITAWADRLRQANADRSMRTARRMMRDTCFGQWFWEMRTLGEECRMRALARLYASYGSPNHCPDPRTKAPFNPVTLVNQVLEDEQIEKGFATPPMRDWAHSYLSRNPMYAWMETHSDGRPPLMVLDMQPAPGIDPQFHDNYLAFDAACVLARYLPDAAMHRSVGVPGELLTPPDVIREPMFTPLFHNFAKGLLLLPRLCPDGSPCECNRVIWDLDGVPPGHPQATGALIMPQDTPPPWRRDTGPQPRRGPNSGPHNGTGNGNGNGPKSRA